MIRWAAGTRELVLLLILSATACGGGSGGSGGAARHAVSTTSSPGGSITPASRSVVDGDAASFTVTPASGHVIAAVTGCGGSLQGETYTLPSVRAPCTVSATFVPGRHRVSVSTGGNGAVTPGDTEVTHGSRLEFRLAPAEGYSVGSVSGCGGTLHGDLYRTEPITGPCSVSANFVVSTHEVTVDVDGNGHLSLTSNLVLHGASLSIIITPELGYALGSIEGCDGSLDGRIYRIGPITEGCTITASFVPRRYVISTTTHGNGTIMPERIEALHGETATLEILPERGYSIVYVSGCNGTLEGHVYTTEPVTFDCTVVALFMGTSISGTIYAPAGSAADSDVNDFAAPYRSNDHFAHAQFIPNPIVFGGYVNEPGRGPHGASFWTGDDIDFFRVMLQPGDAVTLYKESSRIADDVDIYLFDVDEQLIDASLSATARVEALSLADSAPAGEYYLAVHAWSGASNYLLIVGEPLETGTNPLRLSDHFVPGEAVVRFADRGAAPEGDLRTYAEARGWTRDGDRLRTRRNVLLDLREMRQSVGLLPSALERAPTPVLGGWTAGVRHTEPPWLPKLDTLYALKALEADPEVVFAEPNFLYQLHFVPDDPLYDQQWHLAQIGLPEAWAMTSGVGSIIAIIDSGVALEHPDLANQLVEGYDFIVGAPGGNDPGFSPVPRGGSIFHGTHVAGIAAAATNNGLGVAGVAHGARIMPLRACADGICPAYALEQAVRYASGLPNDSGTVAAEPAHVINLSLGRTGPPSESEQLLYDEVRSAGVVVVAAAGNLNASTAVYPAAYEGVIAVSAVDADRQKAPYSSFGTWIDVAAPGGDLRNGWGVLSTYVDDTREPRESTYRLQQGTSMAAPHVSGVIALMKSAAPHLAPGDFTTLLRNGVITDDLGLLGKDEIYGHGLLNAHKAVMEAIDTAGQPVEPLPLLAADWSVLRMGATLEERPFLLRNIGAGSLTVQAPTEDSGGWLNVSLDEGPHVLGAGESLIATVGVDREGLADGLHHATITFPSSSNTIEVQVRVHVTPLAGTDVGALYVVLIDAETMQLQRTTLARRTNHGDYTFTMTDVAPGEYWLLAGSDMNNDFSICTAAGSCGRYPSLNAPEPLVLEGGEVTGLSFVSRYRPELVLELQETEPFNTQ